MTPRLPDALSSATVAYLAAPSIVFLLGWLNLPLGLAVATLLSIALYQLARRCPASTSNHSRAALIFLVTMAMVWAAFGGAGHLVYANIDWLTRDTIYADLILGPWPPSYGSQEEAPLVLRTAMGYYLPPAAIAKVAGIQWAATLLYAWTALGAALFLLLLPLPRQFGWPLVLLAMVAVLFSGMDFLGALLVHGHIPIFPLPLEWWRQWTYSSLTAQLFWSPNHALALWLGTALFFRHREDLFLPALAVVLLPVLLLWTPFAPVGLLPWFVLGIWRTKRAWYEVAKVPTALQWIAACLLVAIVGGLFSSKGLSAGYSPPEISVLNTQATASWLNPELWLNYVQFIGCEFLILALLLIPSVGALRQEFALAVGLLLLIPLYRFGPSNDWELRVSTPSLVILMIVTLTVLRNGFHGGQDYRKQIPLLLVLLIGSITPFFEFSRAILWRQTPPNYGQSLMEQQRGFLAPHFVGSMNSAVLQKMFKKPGRVPSAEDRQALLPEQLRRRQQP